MTENTDTTHPTETVPVAPGSTRPPLRRSSSDRVLAGVAAGFARWLGIDPVIVRVILVVLAVFGGSGLALYAIGWLFIPEDGSTESQAERFIAKGERPGSSMRTALIVTAAVLGTITILSLLASSNDLWVAGGGGSVLLLLAVGGLVLWLVTRDKPATPRAVATTMVPAAMPPDATVGAAPTSTTPEAGADVPAEFITAAAATQVMPELPAGFAYGGAGQYPGYVAPTPVPVPPAPRRPRSYLGLATLSLSLVVMGILATLSLSGAAHIPVVVVMAAGLGVLGLGMLIGAFAGRAKWLMWLAIPLLMVTAAVSVIPANLHISRTTTVGERHWVPTTPAEATTPHTLTIGDATLDLTSLQLAPGTTTSVKAGVGIGAILVTAPAGVHVNVTASSGLGEVAIEGMPRRNGTNVTVVGELEGAVPLGAPTIDLNVQSGVGSVEVRRA